MKLLCIVLLFSASLTTSLAADRAQNLYDAAMEHLHHGVRPDYEKAIAAFRQAMDAGSATAMCALAELYSGGYGEPRNPQEKPILLFRRAAALGSSGAVYELEKRLRVGIGTEIDLLESCAFYYQHNFANISPYKSTVRQKHLENDPNSEAIQKLDKLFEDALKRRDSKSLLDLAKLHADGTHGKPNPACACALLTIARAPQATEMLAKLTPEQRAQMQTDLEWMRLRAN